MTEKHDIRMIELDLDRTTVRADGTIPERNVAALNEAGKQGAEIVIATGRVLDALPRSLSLLDHIKYYICSNGAAVFRIDKADPLSGGSAVNVELLFEKCLEPEAVEAMTEYVRGKGYMFEAFTGGRAYIGKDYYDLVDKGLLMYRSRDYVISTRTPVDDIFSFTNEHKDRIENLNVFFPTQKEKEESRPVLAAIPDSTLTSSIPSNYELGGMGVSKGAALKYLMDIEGLTSENLMAAGDSPNDITMLKLAGIAVAVENAEEVVKQVCDHIAPPCEDAGVGEAVERYVLRR